MACASSDLFVRNDTVFVLSFILSFLLARNSLEVRNEKEVGITMRVFIKTQASTNMKMRRSITNCLQMLTTRLRLNGL